MALNNINVLNMNKPGKTRPDINKQEQGWYPGSYYIQRTKQRHETSETGSNKGNSCNNPKH
jgi:hypothetical protein